MERSLDRSVVSESLLKSIDPNKLRLLNLAFELVPPEWRLPNNADSKVPSKILSKDYRTVKKTRNLFTRSPS